MHNPFPDGADSTRPFIIAGPCAAESERQVLDIAKALNPEHVHLFRAGLWKPRTRPGSFEGVGEIGLKWLQRVRDEIGIHVTTEVARASHVELSLKHGIDALWIGARTSTNPFAVQELAEALKGVDVSVFVKNPVNPELELWIGAVERFAKVGVKRLGAIHRGFSFYGPTLYRNKPHWEIPIEFRRRMPNIPLLTDPSHICGRRDLIYSVAQKALDLGFDGLMIETHTNPDAALSDKRQQLTPEAFSQLLCKLAVRKHEVADPLSKHSLEKLRAVIDGIDEKLLDAIAERMAEVDKVGEVKKENGVAIYQPERWTDVRENVKQWAEEKGLSVDLMLKLYEVIHKESIRRQSNVIHGKGQPTEQK